MEDHENALSNHPATPTDIIIKVIGVLRRTLKGVFDKALKSLHKDPIKGLATGIFEHDSSLSEVLRDCEGTSSPG